MRYKRKLGHGLAFSPEKDMELFRAMAKKGYHLCGLGGMTYKFKKDEPKDYVFSYTAVNNPDDDYVAYFTDAGWEPVILQPGLQIYKALPGTAPIYTETETLVDFYKDQIREFFKYAIGTSIFFIICCYFLLNTSYKILGLILFLIGLIPFIFTVMPLLGFLYHYGKYKKQLS